MLYKAIEDPSRSPISLSYQWGHEMSGTVSTSVGPDGAFDLSRSDEGSLNARSTTGHLTPDQLARLLSAIGNGALLDLRSSERPIGDDEVPILVEVRAGDIAHAVRIWAQDAAENPMFSQFEKVLLEILDEAADSDT